MGNLKFQQATRFLCFLYFYSRFARISLYTLIAKEIEMSDRVKNSSCNNVRNTGNMGLPVAPGHI